jgi:hypothetical protein
LKFPKGHPSTIVSGFRRTIFSNISGHFKRLKSLKVSHADHHRSDLSVTSHSDTFTAIHSPAEHIRKLVTQLARGHLAGSMHTHEAIVATHLTVYTKIGSNAERNTPDVVFRSCPSSGPRKGDVAWLVLADVVPVLLAGFGYLQYEAEEGLDWVWEHMISDLGLVRDAPVAGG